MQQERALNRQRLREMEAQVTEAQEERSLALAQVDTLKEELRRFELSRDRERHANLEYLKNIVLAFIVSNDHHGR